MEEMYAVVSNGRVVSVYNNKSKANLAAAKMLKQLEVEHSNSNVSFETLCKVFQADVKKIKWLIFKRQSLTKALPFREKRNLLYENNL